MIKFFETEKAIEEIQLKELEIKLNFNFRTEYKNHLLKFNGGRCQPNIFSFDENGKLTTSSIDWFLALYNGEYDNLENYYTIYKVDEKRMPSSFFPIAHDSGGNLICIDNKDGKVYFWNHENEVDYKYSEDNVKTNLYFIAENLDSFLSNLTND